MSLNDVVRKMLPGLCVQERDLRVLAKREYRHLLVKYPYADRECLKRLAYRNVDVTYIRRYK